MPKKRTLLQKVKGLMYRIFVEHIADSFLVLVGLKHGAWKPKKAQKKGGSQ